jgi:hypothetical protein
MVGKKKKKKQHDWFALPLRAFQAIAVQWLPMGSIVRWCGGGSANGHQGYFPNIIFL